MVFIRSSLFWCGAALVFALFTFALPTPSHAALCSLYAPGGSILPPLGFGSPYNVISSSQELILAADCNPTGVDIGLGSGDTTNQYIYQYAYEWDGANWNQIQLIGTSQSGDWIPGAAAGTFAKQPSAQPGYFVGFICTWNNQQWKCGCRDFFCNQSFWQLQGYINLAGIGGGSSGGSSTSGGGSSSGGHIPGVGTGDSKAQWEAGDYAAAVGVKTNQNFYANVTGKRTVVTSMGALQSAFNNANPGDAIVLKNGTYSGRVTLRGGGSKGNPIYILAESLHGVTLNSPQFHFENGAHDIHVEGFSIKGGGKIFLIDEDSRDISIIQNKFSGGSRLIDMEWEVNDMEFAHNIVENTTGVTLLIRTGSVGSGKKAPKRPYIHNNVFRDISRNQSNGGEVIHLGFGRYTAPDRNIEALIEYNLFEKTDGDDEIIGFKSHKNVVRRNVFKNAKSHVSIRMGDDNIIEENIILGGSYNIGIRMVGNRNIVRNNFVDLANNGGAAIVFFHREHYSGSSPDQINYDHSRDNQIINNTFVGGNRALRIFSTKKNITGLSKDNTFANNIFVFDNGSDLFQDDSGKLSDSQMINDNTWQNNIFWSKSGGAQNIGGTNKVVDPQLQYTNSIGYPGGPAIDAAVNPTVQTDLFGKQRTNPDIGALER